MVLVVDEDVWLLMQGGNKVIGEGHMESFAYSVLMNQYSMCVHYVII